MPIFDGSFRSKELKNFYYHGTTCGLPVKNTAKLRNVLDYIDTINRLPPSPMLYRAHQYSGKGAGTWSFDITGNMRVLCEFDEDIDPINLRIEDPH